MDVISTLRTNLVPLQRLDFNEILRMYKDPDCFKFIKPHQGLTVQEYQELLEIKLENNNKKVGFWTVRSKETGEFIGNANLYPSVGREIEHLGALFRKKFWNQGYATEVLIALIKYAKEERGLDKVYGIVEEGNATSERLMTKLEFTLDSEEYEDDCLLRFYKKEIGLSN